MTSLAERAPAKTEFFPRVNGGIAGDFVLSPQVDVAIPHAWHEDLDVSSRKVTERSDEIFDEADVLDLSA